jgi:protoporphyrinogen oxidase
LAHLFKTKQKTGLGAAARLHQLSVTCTDLERARWEYLLLESAPEPGGLASTIVTPEGFLFDLGGHVIFSHYRYFEDLLCNCVGNFNDAQTWAVHPRASFVYLQRTFTPYPFQLHFGYLPNLQDKIDCLNGLIEAKVKQASPATKTPSNFDEWIEWTMGSGINNIFMRPYNFKVWAFPTTEMSSQWLGERVAVVNTEDAVRNVLSVTGSAIASLVDPEEPEKLAINTTAAATSSVETKSLRPKLPTHQWGKFKPTRITLITLLCTSLHVCLVCEISYMGSMLTTKMY